LIDSWLTDTEIIVGRSVVPISFYVQPQDIR